MAAAFGNRTAQICRDASRAGLPHSAGGGNALSRRRRNSPGRNACATFSFNFVEDAAKEALHAAAYERGMGILATKPLPETFFSLTEALFANNIGTSAVR